MSKWNIVEVPALCDPATGALVGFIGGDGKEYLIATSSAFAASQPTLYNPGGVAITAGTVLGLTDFGVARTDISGTPGNGTANTTSGRAAFAAAGTTVTVTNSKCTTNSKVFVQLGGADATLTSVRVTPGAGSFVVTGNAAATGTTPFDFFVVN